MSNVNGGRINNRQIKALIITLGGEREKILRELFESPSYKPHFDVTFQPGVPQREIRSRRGLYKAAHAAGLIPQHEWDEVLEEYCSSISTTSNNTVEDNEVLNEKLAQCHARHSDKIKRRHGSEQDANLAYSLELWRKAKSLSRQRAVLACTLAHLIAIKKCLTDGHDLILEDNVRPIQNCKGNVNDDELSIVSSAPECTRRIRRSICELVEKRKDDDEAQQEKCDLLYFGWLGSAKHLEWVIQTHSVRYSNTKSNTTGSCSFPYPSVEDNELGGTALWGAYAYWVSEQGYEAVLEGLKRDVGGLLWKGKRMRQYMAKPIDKILPRRVLAANLQVCVSNRPSFFRAPMLTSKIHTQWDPEFCKSTELQLELTCGSSWEDLWLTKTEQSVVSYKRAHGKWITPMALLNNDAVDSYVEE